MQAAMMQMSSSAYLRSRQAYGSFLDGRGGDVRPDCQRDGAPVGVVGRRDRLDERQLCDAAACGEEAEGHESGEDDLLAQGAVDFADEDEREAGAHDVREDQEGWSRSDLE